MIDAKSLARELEQARLARREAEEAVCDMEELIWEVQHLPLGQQRVVFSIAGFDQSPVV